MLDVEDHQELVYRVCENNGRFEVCAASGRAVMVCNDEGSATHYASLLSEAWRAGYKMGYRDARKKSGQVG